MHGNVKMGVKDREQYQNNIREGKYYIQILGGVAKRIYCVVLEGKKRDIYYKL